MCVHLKYAKILERKCVENNGEKMERLKLLRFSTGLT